MSAIFITGTCTDVGKTVVTASCLLGLQNMGLDVVPMKPIQSGAKKLKDGSLLSQDLQFSLEFANLTAREDEQRLMSPYLFQPACSPHLAAKMANQQINLNSIVMASKELENRHDAVLIEGAGGVLVPINEHETMLDLMLALKHPVILVANTELGTINRTLLSIKILQMVELDILGIIFNNTTATTSKNQFIRSDNPAIIQQLSQVDILGNLPFVSDVYNKQLQKLFLQAIPNFDGLYNALNR